MIKTITVLALLALCTTGTEASFFNTSDACFIGKETDFLFRGYKDFWPLPVDSGVKEPDDDTRFESQFHTAQRVANFFDAYSGDVCVIDIDYVMYLAKPVLERDQNKENAPVAVRRRAGGEFSHSYTNFEIWRVTFVTHSEDVFKRIDPDKGQVITNASARAKTVTGKQLVLIVLASAILLCVRVAEFNEL